MIFWPSLRGVRFHTARVKKSPSNRLEMMSALPLIPEIEDSPHAPYQPTELPFSAVAGTFTPSVTRWPTVQQSTASAMAMHRRCRGATQIAVYCQ